MSDEGRKRAFDPKPPKASLSLGDFTGQVVGFFGCGDYGQDDNPQFENSEFVPVGTVAVFKKPVSEGTEEVATNWRCFNARLRHQLVNEPGVIGQLQGKGRAGSPYEVVPLPEGTRGDKAYTFVLNLAMKEGWVDSPNVKQAANRPERKDDDEF